MIGKSRSDLILSNVVGWTVHGLRGYSSECQAHHSALKISERKVSEQSTNRPVSKQGQHSSDATQRSERFSEVVTHNMVTHGNKQIKEHLPSLLHVRLHRSALFERPSAPNDESKVVSTQLGVAVGCVGVSPTGGGEDGGDLHAGA